MDMKAVFTGLAAGQRPNADTFSEVFAHMISGDMPEAQITAFLLGLEQIGITSAELTIGANVLRNVMSKISAPEGATFTIDGAAPSCTTEPAGTVGGTTG